MANRGQGAGFYRALAWAVDDDGYAMGTLANPNSPSVNTVYSPHLIPDPVSFSGVQVARRIVRDVGGTSNRGSVDIGSGEAQDGSFQQSNYDVDFHNLVTGTATDNSIMPGFQLNSPDIDAKPATIGFMTCEGFHDRLDGAASYGNPKYLSRIYLRTQFSPRGMQASQNDGTNPNPVDWTFSAQKGSVLPNGLAISATALGLTGNTGYYVQAITDYPLHMVTWVANGSATTFTLPYLPIYDDEDNAANNIITKNGAKTAVTSVNTSSGLVTLTAAGDSGDVWVVIYKTNYAASS